MDRHDWNRRYETSELVWTATPNRFVVAEVEGLPPGRALDLACGEGRNAVWLASLGWTVTGADFSDVAIAKAHRLAEARGVEVEWVVADVAEYVPEPEAFDLVVLAYLQVRAPERRAVLRAAAGGVAPGGRIVVVAHDRSNLDGGQGGPQDPAVLYTLEDVAADLAGTGLAVSGGVVERPVETPEGFKPAYDLLARALRFAR